MILLLLVHTPISVSDKSLKHLPDAEGREYSSIMANGPFVTYHVSICAIVFTTRTRKVEAHALSLINSTVQYLSLIHI